MPLHGVVRSPSPFAESDTHFFMTSQPVVFDFQKEADGSIKRVKERNGPERLEGEKISDVPRQ
jgi:hypothetical protein